MNDSDIKASKRNRFIYILEAALEYLISILVAGSFLAALTKELGLSDSLTGILSSMISLGCLFQLLSVFFHCKNTKLVVIIMSIANQLLFMFLYVIPVFRLSQQLKTIIFVFAIFSAYVIYNFAHPKKTSWLMSLVDDNYRGRFTASKEIVSLLAGMIFSYAAGVMVDSFFERGEQRSAFILSAIVIFILMLLHTVFMYCEPEPAVAETPSQIPCSEQTGDQACSAAELNVLKHMGIRPSQHLPNIRASNGTKSIALTCLIARRNKNITTGIKDILQNKNTVHAIVIFVLYYISTYTATPFYGTYLINELALNLKSVSILTIFSSIVRILVSRFWGSYADKTSFTNMIQKCLCVLALGYLCAACAVPANGKIMFTFYYLFYGVALGGINSALTNLVFDYVSVEKRADSLAICQAVSGLAGFLATLAASPLITYIQRSNRIAGLTFYAQQVVSAIALGITVITIIYIHIIQFNRKRN